MHWAPADETVVGRLRLKARGQDPLAARLQAAALFGLLSLEPGGLAPNAILCIRSLRDPKPGLLAEPASGMRARLLWERAVNESIQDLARHAARPIERAVPANAQAVQFAACAEWMDFLGLGCAIDDLIRRW